MSRRATADELRRMAADSRLTQRERVLMAVAGGAGVSQAEVARVTGLWLRSARNRLDELEADGLLRAESEGPGKSKSYRLGPCADPAQGGPRAGSKPGTPRRSRAG